MNKLSGPLLILILVAGTCDGGQGTFQKKDAGNGVGLSYTYDDIGTRCTYDPTQPTQNPTNTCGKAGMVCVIATSDGMYREYGSFLYEAIPLFSRFLPDGTDEGICTLLSRPGMIPPACPSGTMLVKLSTGHHLCMRGCSSSADCGRNGYVCDYPWMDGRTYDSQTGAVAPLPVKACKPSCATDLPYCTRTFLIPDGAGGEWLMVAGSDLMGNHECEPVSGLCQDVATRGLKFVGDQCVHSSECRDGLICIGGMLFGAPDQHGFCARTCNPAAERQNPPQPSGCEPGQGCEFFLDIGYCFPDCINNVCGGPNQVCQFADPGTAGLRPGQEWLRPRCVPCELSSLPCASSVDAGSGEDI